MVQEYSKGKSLIITYYVQHIYNFMPPRRQVKRSTGSLILVCRYTVELALARLTNTPYFLRTYFELTPYLLQVSYIIQETRTGPTQPAKHGAIAYHEHDYLAGAFMYYS